MISLQYDIKLLRLPPWRVGTKLTCLVLLHKNPTAGLPNITKTQTFKHQNVWLFVNNLYQVRRLKKAAEVRLSLHFSPPKVTQHRGFRRCFCGIKTRQDKYTNCSFFFLMLLFQPQCFYRCIKWDNMATPNGPGVRLPKKPFHWPRSLQRNKARASGSAFVHTLL